ncbi:MAG: hypothetical protein WD469_08520 [Paenibacillaceae bacterium]
MKKAIAVLITFILLAAVFSPTVTNAAQQQINVGTSVFFTLDKVTLTSSMNAQALSFTLNLSNQSTQNVDLNQYGVRVLDKDGDKYSAQLAEKASARVLPKLVQGFKYTSTVPKNISISQLSVEVFAWDYSLPSFMRVLGSLKAASAASKATSNKQVTINLSALDAALPKNTTASFALLNSFKTLKNGEWVVYSNFLVENLSAKAAKLPANLFFNLRGSGDLYGSTAVVAGQSQTLLPQTRSILTFQTLLKSFDTPQGLTFEMAKRPVVVNTSGILLASFALDASLVEAHVGTVLTIPSLSSNVLTLVAEKVIYNHNAFNNVIDVAVTLKNEGKSALPVPSLSGYFQAINSTLSIPAAEVEPHPVVLSANQSTTYHFTVEFPLATDESMIQLVITGNKSSAQVISKPIDVISLTSSNIQAGEQGLAEVIALDLHDIDTTFTSNSMLSFQVIRSYHSIFNGDPVINLEVIAQNESAVAFKLPTSLLFTLQDRAQLSYPSTIMSGADQTIMPHQSIPFTLQAVLGKKDSQTSYTLNLVKKSLTPAGADLVYDTLDVASSFSNSQVANSLLNTSIGKLGVALKSTYRLATASGDDILLSEIQLQNLDNKTITLPNQAGASLFGGYMLNDFDAAGKLIRIQTSPYLYPNQKTTLYIYTKIPYTSSATSGYIYLGDGILNGQTAAWTQTHEWTEIPFSLGGSTVPLTLLNNEWMLADAGRTSTGKIVDSQIYDLNNQKLLAVRILQTNKEPRNGSIVPYTGYLTNADGSVLSLKTTDDAAATSILCNQCTALSTLWTTLPLGFSTANQHVVFGPKLDDQSFNSPQQYAFQSSTPAVNNGSISNAAIYPFTVSVQNAKFTTTSIGSGQNAVLGYDINLDYTINKSLDLTGAVKNRGLQFTLTEADGKVVKTWETLLDGVDAWTTGKNKLSFLETDIPDLQSFINSRQLNVYEKFEGGTRLLGSITPSF